MDAPGPVQLAAALFLGALSLAVLSYRGVLSARAFDARPPRAGSLGISDLFITAGLFLLVPSFFVTAFIGFTPTDKEATLGDMLRQMLWAQAGMAVAAAFAFGRAHTLIAGGLRGWGLGLGSPLRTVTRASIGFLAIFPVILAVSAVMSLSLAFMGHEPPTIAHPTLDALLHNPRTASWWGMVISAVVIAPVVEELIFRGMVQTALLQSGVTRSRWSAIAWTSLVFASVHIGSVDFHALPVLYVLSLALGWTYERWGSLWTPILLHVLFNTSQIVLALNIPTNGD